MGGEKPAGKPAQRVWPWWRPLARKGRIYYLRQFPRRKRLHGGFLHRLLGNRLFDPGLWIPTRESVARGLAVGIFLGLMPFFGAQIILSLAFSLLFRVNVSAAVIATFISNPLTTFPILALQLQVGKLIVDTTPAGDAGDTAGALKFVVANAKPLLFGSLATAAAAALITYPLALLLWSGVTRLRARPTGPQPSAELQPAAPPEPPRTTAS